MKCTKMKPEEYEDIKGMEVQIQLPSHLAYGYVAQIDFERGITICRSDTDTPCVCLRNPERDDELGNMRQKSFANIPSAMPLYHAKFREIVNGVRDDRYLNTERIFPLSWQGYKNGEEPVPLLCAFEGK